ncbi:MAG: hypothetical protein U1C33_04805 [Candidatus Cloacimonadaceae bacterium]|nr:hypothetical protein [Candidatus Cloacimonadaceae bacterium]
MKKILLATMLLLAALALAAQPFTLPRVYVQRLVLENGENPQITWDGKTSAPEYQLKAWMIERPKDIMTTDKNPIILWRLNWWETTSAWKKW